jgi:hypothetical protein
MSTSATFRASKALQADFCIELEQGRLKTALWQAPLHGHLTALETNLVVTTSARFLTFVPASGCFTQARTNSTANTTFVVLGTVSGFNTVKFHRQPLKAP